MLKKYLPIDLINLVEEYIDYKDEYNDVIKEMKSYNPNDRDVCLADRNDGEKIVYRIRFYGSADYMFKSLLKTYYGYQKRRNIIEAGEHVWVIFSTVF